MASVHLGWRPAWDFTCGCGHGRPNPVAMVRRPSSSTSKRASNDCVYALSFRTATTVRVSVWLSFHQRDNDKQSPTLLLDVQGTRRATPKNETALGLPREPAVQHHKTNGIQATKQLKHVKSQACSQDNFTRQRKNRLRASSWKLRKKTRSSTPPPTHSPTLIKQDKWNTGVHETMIMHVTFHDGFHCVHACDLP